MAGEGGETEAKAGDVVDRRYVLKREMARGGMGAVFEAEHAHTGRTLALKLLHDVYRHREDVRQRLLREARALTVARHPGVVDVLDAGICDRAGPFVVLEMLEGRTLDGLITARGRLSIDDTVQVGRQLAEALAFGHAHGVVHRDVKPSNVFVVRNGLGHEVIKLVDFGIARLHGEPAGDLGPVAGDKLTRAGEVIGTPEYMAPEQLLAKEVMDHRCDVYGAAVTLYECLTGDVPFTGTYADILMKLVGKNPVRPDVRAARPEVPVAVAAAIEKGLAIDPDDRHADCLVFADVLIAAGGVGVRASALFTDKVRAVPPPVPAMAQRKHPRAPYVTPARVLASTAGEATVDGRTEDVSEAGLLLVADASWKSGDEVLVRFALPMTGTIEQIPAVVRWSRAGRQGRTATGLEFTHLNPIARAVIAEYVGLMGAPAR